MDKPAIYDICLTFFFKQIWSILSVSSSSWVKNIDTQSNKDITLHDIDLGDHIVKTTVHKSNTVSVMVACNLSPMPIDMLGLVKISSSSVRVEVRLQLLVNDYVNASIQNTGNK